MNYKNELENATSWGFWEWLSRAESIFEQNDVSYDVQWQNYATSGKSNNSEIRSRRYRVVDDHFSSGKLPSINLRNFSGECGDWLQFEDTFDSLSCLK